MNRNKKAEVNKVFVVFIIGAIAILALAALLWFGPTSAGKAIYAGGAGTVGIFAPGTVSLNTPFEMIVGANIGDDNTVAIRFILPLPNGISCEGVTVTSLLWEDPSLFLLNQSECKNNQITFAYATAAYNQTKNQSIDIAKISFPGIKVMGEYSFHFSSFEIVNFSDAYNNLALNPSGIIVSVKGVCSNGATNYPYCTLCPENWRMDSQNHCFKAFTGSGEVTLTLKEKGTLQEVKAGTLSSSKEYELSIGITPQVKLSKDHLVLTTIGYNGTQEVQYWNRMPALYANRTEWVTLDHKVLTKNSPLTIKVMVWKDFLSSTLPWESLMDYTEINYEIK